MLSWIQTLLILSPQISRHIVSEHWGVGVGSYIMVKSLDSWS